VFIRRLGRIIAISIMLMLALNMNNEIVRVYAVGQSAAYSITPINVFSSAFGIALQGFGDEAAYFNVYKKSFKTFISSNPVAVGDSIKTMPAVYSDINDLEVRIYTDASGMDTLTEFTLISPNQLIQKDNIKISDSNEAKSNEKSTVNESNTAETNISLNTTELPASNDTTGSTVISSTAAPLVQGSNISNSTNNSTIKSDRDNANTGIEKATEMTARTFPDVKKDSELGKAVTILVNKQIVAGLPDGTFGATLTLTREQAAKIAVLLYGITESELTVNTTKFSDVKANRWSLKYIAKSEKLGFIKGYNGQFAPEEKLTCEQWMAILLRVIGKEDEVSATGKAWPENYLLIARKYGLMGKDQIHTDAGTSRGDMALAAVKALKLMETGVRNVYHN
jgi:hypothetical protein